MRKLGILGTALCALLALSAFVASAAFAADEAIWLVNGALVLENLNAETEGELLLAIYNGNVILVEIKCSYILGGTIGPNGVDEITKMLTLTELEVGNDGATLTGSPLLCESFISPEAFDCEAGAEKIEFWPANLPWKTQLELMLVTGEEDILDVFIGTGGEPGLGEIRCKTLSGLTLENLCTGPVTMLVENSGTGSVLSFFNKVPLAERGNCTLTGEHTAEIVSDLSSDTWAIGAALERLTTAVNDCEAEPTACTE